MYPTITDDEVKSLEQDGCNAATIESYDEDADKLLDIGLEQETADALIDIAKTIKEKPNSGRVGWPPVQIPSVEA